jgi:hypothetical protein
MSLFNKLRSGTGQSIPPQGHAYPRGSVATATASSPSKIAPAGPASVSRGSRASNGLKEFLNQLDGIGHGHLLDMGSARQTTLNFFIERGFKVYTEDMLETWKLFLDSDDRQAQESRNTGNPLEMKPAARAERFLETTLQYPKDTIDAVLMWDILDYLDSELVSRLMVRITSLVRDGGVVMAIFHTRKPESFHRYRVVDAQTLELIPAPCAFSPQRVYQNREIADLFRRFRTSRTFVGREQFRESLFVK